MSKLLDGDVIDFRPLEGIMYLIISLDDYTQLCAVQV